MCQTQFSGLSITEACPPPSSSHLSQVLDGTTSDIDVVEAAQEPLYPLPDSLPMPSFGYIPPSAFTQPTSKQLMLVAKSPNVDGTVESGHHAGSGTLQICTEVQMVLSERKEN